MKYNNKFIIDIQKPFFMERLLRRTCVQYQLVSEPDGTEFDGVTTKRRPQLLLTGQFTKEQKTEVEEILTEHGVAFTYTQYSFVIPLAALLSAQAALEKHGFFTNDSVPYDVWKWMCSIQARPSVSEEDLKTKLGDAIWNNLHPYQRVCVKKAVEAKRFYIADEMGTGKTFQCLATCKYFSDQWPALVFCPSSLRYNWRTEIVRWLGLSESDVLVPKHSKHYVINHKTKHKFLIMPYSLLIIKSVIDILKQMDYKIVVFDEAHYVKSSVSKRANQAYLIAQNAPVKLLLSGTPFNYPSEMYQQIKIIESSLYPKFFNYRLIQEHHDNQTFAGRYCKPKHTVIRGKSLWSFTGYDRHKELNAVLDTFMIRRRKVDILTQLPEKNRICITLEPLTKKQDEEIATMLKKEKEDVDDQKQKKSEKIKYMESFRLTNRYKIPNVMKFIKEYMLDNYMKTNDKIKTLIFFHHEVMQQALEELLNDYSDFPYFVISGSTSAKKRDEYKDDFQTTEKYRIGLLSITAAGVGLTLTAASVEIFTEILFGPNDHLQAEDRAHRMGQKSTVNIFYLLQPKTTDDINFGLILKKERESSMILDGTPNMLQSTRVTCHNMMESGIEKMKKPEQQQPPAKKYITKRSLPVVYRLDVKDEKPE